MPDGETVSDLKTDANILHRPIEDIGTNQNWSQFEENLGMINYRGLIDLS